MTAVEICLDDVRGAADAERAGASRVELCAALSQGGTTPSIGLVRTVLETVSRIGVQVLVRPRAGDSLLGGSVRAHNVADLLATTAAPEVHLRAGSAADVIALIDALPTSGS